MENNEEAVRITIENGKCIARPGIFKGKKGGKFKIVSEHEMMLFFPRKNIFENLGESVQTVKKNVLFEQTIKKKIDSNKKGIPYAVYIEGMKDFAEGNSSPRIIIEE